MKKALYLFMMILMILCLNACDTEKEISQIKVGEKIEAKTYEYEITDIFFSKFVNKPNTIYLDVNIKFTNFGTSDLYMDNMVSGTMTYGDSEKYIGKYMAGGSFLTTVSPNENSVKPQGSCLTHLLFEVSNEIATSDTKITISMKLAGTPYELIARDENGVMAEGSTIQLSNLNKLTLEETVTTENSEFSVQKAAVTKRIEGYLLNNEAPSGNQFLDVCIAYENKSNEPLSKDVISAKLQYSDLYVYDSVLSSVTNIDDPYYTATSIAPHSKNYIHYYFLVPSNTTYDKNVYDVVFTVDEKTYSCEVR